VCPACRRRLFGFNQGRLLGRTGNAQDDDVFAAAPVRAAEAKG